MPFLVVTNLVHFRRRHLLNIHNNDFTDGLSQDFLLILILCVLIVLSLPWHDVSYISNDVSFILVRSCYTSFQWNDFWIKFNFPYHDQCFMFLQHSDYRSCCSRKAYHTLTLKCWKRERRADSRSQKKKVAAAVPLAVALLCVYRMAVGSDHTDNQYSYVYHLVLLLKQLYRHTAYSLY